MGAPPKRVRCTPSLLPSSCDCSRSLCFLSPSPANPSRLRRSAVYPPAVPPRLLSGRWSLSATGCACGRPLRLQTRSFTVAQEGVRLFLASTPSLEWFSGEVRDEALRFSIIYRGEGEGTHSESEGGSAEGGEGGRYQLDFVATRFSDLFFEGFFSGTTPGCLNTNAPLGRFTIDLLVVGLGAEEE